MTEMERAFEHWWKSKGIVWSNDDEAFYAGWQAATAHCEKLVKDLKMISSGGDYVGCMNDVQSIIKKWETK